MPVECTPSPALPVPEGVRSWLEPLLWYERLMMFVFILAFVGFWAGNLFGGAFHPKTNIWWVICFPLSVPARAFVKARRRELSHCLERFLPPDSGLFGSIREFIVRNEEGWDPAIVGLLTGGFFGAFRLAVTFDIWSAFFTTGNVFVLLLQVMGLVFIGRGIWSILSYGMLMNRLSRDFSGEAKKTFSWGLLESLGYGYARASVGAGFLSFGFLTMVLSHLRLFAAEAHAHATLVLLMEIVFAIALLFPLGFLLLPQWRLHTILVERKSGIRGIFEQRLLVAEREFLQNPSPEQAQTYLAAREVSAEIENLPEWPFRFESLAPMLTLAVLPGIVVFGREILLNLVVDLVKGP